MDDRRGYQDFIALINDLRADVRGQKAELMGYMERMETNITTRINDSHRGNQLWQMSHAGPSADSMHGQETAKRTRHYQEHADFREKQFDPLVEKVNHAKWTIGGILLIFSALWAAFLKWWPE